MIRWEAGLPLQRRVPQEKKITSKNSHFTTGGEWVGK
jgi:hypothetical protein